MSIPPRSHQQIEVEGQRLLANFFSQRHMQNHWHNKGENSKTKEWIAWDSWRDAMQCSYQERQTLRLAL